MCSFFHWCCFYTRMFLLTRFHQRLLPIYMSFILKAQWGYFCCQFMDSEEYICFPAINPAYVAVSSQSEGKMDWSGTLEEKSPVPPVTGGQLGWVTATGCVGTQAAPEGCHEAHSCNCQWEIF